MLLSINRSYRLKMTCQLTKLGMWFFILISLISQNKISSLLHLYQRPKLSDVTKIVLVAPLGLIFLFVYPLPFLSALGSSLNLAPGFVTDHWLKRNNGLRASADEFLWWRPGLRGELRTLRDLTTCGARMPGWVTVLSIVKLFPFRLLGAAWNWETWKLTDRLEPFHCLLPLLNSEW